MTLIASEAVGTFEGYASLFGLADLARDIVMPGAFLASLQKRGLKNIRLLFQHDPSEPLGIWQDLYEDQRGLYCRGSLNLDVQRGREIYALLRQGAIDGLSIGFKTVHAERAALGGRRLTVIDLWEISLVSFPLLPEARVSAVKSHSRPQTSFSNHALLTRARTLFHPR